MQINLKGRVKRCRLPADLLGKNGAHRPAVITRQDIDHLIGHRLIGRAFIYQLNRLSGGVFNRLKFLFLQANLFGFLRLSLLVSQTFGDDLLWVGSVCGINGHKNIFQV